jgi:hypothetical protein
MLAVDDGWSKAIQACKGDGNKRLLDEDKKGSSKAKEEVYFCSNCCSLCKRKNLSEYVVAVLFFHCASDYTMVGSMFLSELGVIKG